MHRTSCPTPITGRPHLSSTASEPAITTTHRPSSTSASSSSPATPFVCTFCHHLSTPPAHLVGRSARLTCAPCHVALTNLAVCWRCGELVHVGDACVSLGWCFWHRVCFGCLLCGSPVPGGEGLWRDRGRSPVAVEVDEVPLCEHCLAETESTGLGGEDVVRKGLEGVEAWDGGMNRVRYEKRKRGRECAVPLDSTIYVSIANPLDGPTFKPSPTKPIPAQMRPPTADAEQIFAVHSPFSYSARNHRATISCPPRRPSRLAYPPTTPDDSSTPTPSPSTATRAPSPRVEDERQTVPVRPRFRNQRYSHVSNEPLLRPSARDAGWQSASAARASPALPESPSPTASTTSLPALAVSAEQPTMERRRPTLSQNVVTAHHTVLSRSPMAGQGGRSEQHRRVRRRARLPAPGESSEFLDRYRWRPKGRTVVSTSYSTVARRDVSGGGSLAE